MKFFIKMCLVTLVCFTWWVVVVLSAEALGVPYEYFGYDFPGSIVFVSINCLPVFFMWRWAIR